MGNTKYVAFAGYIYKGEEAFFTEQALLEEAHGDHVAVKVLPGYLHCEAMPAKPDEDPFVIGYLTSHSMSGFAVIDHITAHMKSGHITKTDVDCGYSYWFHVEHRAITERVKICEMRIKVMLRAQVV